MIKDTADQAPREVQVLGIPGSLRAASSTRALLSTAAAVAPAGLAVQVFDGLKLLPPFDEDDEATPGPVVSELRCAVASADALLVATPEYNGTLPGQLKHAIDWLSRPRGRAALAGIPTVVIGGSPSPRGGAQAYDDARRVLGRAGAEVLDLGFTVPTIHERVRDGVVVDPELIERLQATLGAVRSRIRQPALGEPVRIPA